MIRDIVPGEQSKEFYGTPYNAEIALECVWKFIPAISTRDAFGVPQTVTHICQKAIFKHALAFREADNISGP